MIRFIARGEPGAYPGSAFVRTVARAEASRSLLGEEVVFTTVEDWLADPSGTEALLVERDAVPADLVDAVVEACTRDGVRLVVDLDDDLLSPSSRQRLVEGGYLESDLDGLERIVAAADAVVVSTDELASRIGALARSVHVVPNRLSPLVWTEPVDTVPTRRPTGSVRVLYMGSATHADDIAIVREAFDGRQTPFGSRLELDVVGVLDDDETWFTRLDVPRNARAYDRFSHWLRSHRRRWDIGIAPLADTEFNHAKSDLKFLEYTSLGLPTVASAIGPYAGTDRHGAVLVDNDPDAWFAALGELADYPDRRRSAVDESRGYVAEERTLDTEASLADWWAVLRPTG
ncbi:glycosyltransferase [Labedella endophytica]|uniref:Glycosyltransferase n=1 Tax=Labedella endophytica TaxID=1523160 RepID=A0A3S0V8M6_9MICO|nr:glycosyltransferase [Labedella endophytica]RUQ98024.1 glycosyltransferase [Labedella endophytica]